MYLPVTRIVFKDKVKAEIKVKVKVKVKIKVKIENKVWATKAFETIQTTQTTPQICNLANPQIKQINN